jgi:hypothetical protein
MIAPGCECRRGGPDRIEQLPPGDEDDAGAGGGEKPAAPARVALEIEPAAVHGAERDRIDHQPRFPASLDREQPADLFQHHQSLTFERFDGCFARFVS